MQRGMKKLCYIVVLLLFAGCNSENALNCFQASGTIIQEEFTVAPFSRIIVWERVHLFIEEGDEQKVVVETGENLLNDIELKVENGQLAIFNNNGCNLVRDYGITKVYVTTPNITEIRSSTGLPVESVGQLNFPDLLLLSEDRENEDEFHTDGDFILNLNVERLKIVANGLSKFYISGIAKQANIELYASDTRVEAQNLLVDYLYIFHRSTNVMIVNPQESIRGEIRSLGNVISRNRPSIVDVEEFYTGRLIFE
jgi:hypothetical protein